MTSEFPNNQVDPDEGFHPAGVALLLEALGAVPASCLDRLAGSGFVVKTASGRASGGQQRIGSNVKN